MEDKKKNGGKRKGAGRPKGAISKVKQTLKEMISDDMAKELIAKLFEQAKNGSTDAAKYLIDQKYGKANQSIDNNISGGVMIIKDDIE